jgi:CBS domain-containing protein
MTPNPVTVGPSSTLAEATSLIVERELKRVPVVESDGRLIGILSRADVLRAVAEAFPTGRIDAPNSITAAPHLARDVMRTDAPVVAADAGLPEVVDAVCSTRLNRAVVVDAERRPIGLVTDAAVLRALGAAGRGVVGALMRSVGIADAPAGTARDLMVTPTYSVDTAAPLASVARVMTEHSRKIVPVVDDDGRLLGIIDRADLLRATHAALHNLGAIVAPDEDE